jgi:hypothetical protein
MAHDHEDASQEPTEADLAAVAGFLAEIEQIETKPAEWNGGKQSDGSIQMPFVTYEPAAARLLRALYSHKVVILGFDWTSWREEARRFLDPAAVRAASLVEVRRLLTLHARQDRFVEGHFADMISSGHVSALLRRLGELTREASATDA